MPSTPPNRPASNRPSWTERIFMFLSEPVWPQCARMGREISVVMVNVSEVCCFSVSLRNGTTQPIYVCSSHILLLSFNFFFVISCVCFCFNVDGDFFAVACSVLLHSGNVLVSECPLRPFVVVVFHSTNCRYFMISFYSTKVHSVFYTFLSSTAFSIQHYRGHPLLENVLISVDVLFLLVYFCSLNLNVASNFNSPPCYLSPFLCWFFTIQRRWSVCSLCLHIWMKIAEEA